DDLCWSRSRSFRAVGSRRRSRPATAIVGSDVAVSICPQALQLGRIGPHNPTLPPTGLLARLHQAMLHPVDEAVVRHLQPLGQLSDPPFILPERVTRLPERVTRLPAPVRRAQSQLAPQRLHTRPTPAPCRAQGGIPITLELGGNGVQRPSGVG